MKKDIQLLLNFVNSINIPEIWTSTQLTTLSVLLQNMLFYSEDEGRLRTYLTAIDCLQACLEGEYVVKFVSEQLEMSITGHFMEYDDFYDGFYPEEYNDYEDDYYDLEGLDNSYYGDDFDVDLQSDSKNEVIPEIGSSIHLKSRRGIYQVVGADDSSIMITTQKWNNEWLRGDRSSNCLVVPISDFKCYKGVPSSRK